MYVVNALYLWPITLWTYLQYGRPPRLPRTANGNSASAGHDSSCAETKHAHCGQSSASYSGPDDHLEPTVDPDTGSGMQTEATATHSSQSHHHQHHASGERPLFATVTVAVCHCGAGCVIGDIIGEWLVYGTNATINGRPLWPAYLIGKLAQDFHPSRKKSQSRPPFVDKLRFGVGDRTWYPVPVLLHRAHDRRVRAQDDISRGQGRHPVFGLLRDRAVRLDGYFPDRHFSVEARGEHGGILVDDAGTSHCKWLRTHEMCVLICEWKDRHVHWTLDRSSDQLLVDQRWD